MRCWNLRIVRAPCRMSVAGESWALARFEEALDARQELFIDCLGCLFGDLVRMVVSAEWSSTLAHTNPI